MLSVSHESGRVLGDDFTGQVATVEIGRLLPSDLIRLDGISEEHVALIADSELCMPPIVVHKATMRVIDGMHRLRAAILRGEDSIRVTWFDGTPEAAFILSVTANNAHGLPLTAADRRAAAGRLLALRPDSSDRAIAAIVGVSARTVAAVRCSTGQTAQLNGRVGRDGRVRPVSTVDGRLKAAELMAARPGATLRELAKETGLSLGTVADVRRRVLRGDSPVPSGQSGPAAAADPPGASASAARVDLTASWRQLTRDPSLRYTSHGRELLRLLRAHSSVAQIAPSVPSHCSQNVALLARECAQAWGQLAQRLEGPEPGPADGLG
ncbi:ParB/RepB/Spo0J family partition protein [Streptomyces sp. NPDC047072]|uniref:ParB/RepB/Spo0J family partition protein n=1 Tax=Streptomyces sp. NPDC047072 TaxID=3154809 RepID=UPI0034078DA4